MVDALTRGLIQHLSPRATPAVRADAGLEEKLAALLARCTAAYPTLGLPAVDFLAHLARTLETAGARGADVGTLHEDLYLACACVLRHPDALRTFEQTVLGPVLRKVGTSAPEDLGSRVREKLLVGPDARLREYSGRGSLAKWTRMVALRLTLDAQKGQRQEVSLPGSDAAISGLIEADPELAAIKQQAGALVRQALVEAYHGLPKNDRRLLRLHHVDKLPHGAIGTLIGAPRSTVAHWLKQAAEALLTSVRGRLTERLGESELESVLRVARSQLDLSLSELLPMTSERTPEPKSKPSA